MSSLGALSGSLITLAVSLSCSDVIVETIPVAGEMSAGEIATGGVSTGGIGTGGMGAGGLSAGGEVTLPDECSPGDELGLCAICGISSTPIEPIDDPNCPYIPCEELTTYQAVELDDGGRQCLQFTANPPLSRCKGLGMCYTDPAEACTINPEPEVLLVAYPGCNEFNGCEGDVSPDAVLRGVGDECHSLGTCTESGQCSAPASCTGSKPMFVEKHCPDPNTPVNEVEGCDLLIDMDNIPDRDQISCTLACATENGCVTGWDVSGDCQRGGEIGCSNSRARLICRCNGS